MEARINLLYNLINDISFYLVFGKLSELGERKRKVEIEKLLKNEYFIIKREEIIKTSEEIIDDYLEEVIKKQEEKGL